MSEPQEKLELLLKQRGFSLTLPRKIVFEALVDSEPLTMHELSVKCNAIDRASVYRVVTLFESLGVIQRLQIGWKYKLELTDSFVHHHHHLSCLHCGTVIPLPEDQQLEKRLVQLAKQHGFLAQDHQLELRGLCSNCHGV